MSRIYDIGGRYGYFCVDVYNEKGELLKTAICGLTRKVAQQVADELNEAYKAGKEGTSHIERAIKNAKT